MTWLIGYIGFKCKFLIYTIYILHFVPTTQSQIICHQILVMFSIFIDATKLHYQCCHNNLHSFPLYSQGNFFCIFSLTHIFVDFTKLLLLINIYYLILYQLISQNFWIAWDSIWQSLNCITWCFNTAFSEKNILFPVRFFSSLKNLSSLSKPVWSLVNTKWNPRISCTTYISSRNSNSFESLYLYSTKYFI